MLQGSYSKLSELWRAITGALSFGGSSSRGSGLNRAYSSGVSFSGIVTGLSNEFVGSDDGILSIVGAYSRQCLFFRTLNSTLAAVAPGGPESEIENAFGQIYMDMTLRM